MTDANAWAPSPHVSMAVRASFADLARHEHATNVAMPKNNARFILNPPTKQVPYHKGNNPNDAANSVSIPNRDGVDGAGPTVIYLLHATLCYRQSPQEGQAASQSAGVV